MSEVITPPPTQDITNTPTPTATPATITQTPANTQAKQDKLYSNKYKTVEDLEKGYNELQSLYTKKMGSFTGTPEEYKIEVDSMDESILNFAKEWGKNNNLSNEGLNNLLSSYQEFKTKQSESLLEKEYSKLGENAEERISGIEEWANANIPAEKIPTLKTMFNSAEAVELLEDFIKLTKPKPLINDRDTAITSNETKNDLMKKASELLNARDKNNVLIASYDKNHQSKVDELYKRALNL